MSARGKLPDGYIDIEKAVELCGSSTAANITGVVTDTLEPKMSKGTDHMSTLKIQDMSSIQPNAKHSWLRVRIFNRYVEKLPRPSVGDVILLRNFKFTFWAGDPLAYSSNWSQWLVYAAAKIPSTGFQEPFALGRELPSTNKSSDARAANPAEAMYIIYLHENAPVVSNLPIPPRSIQAQSNPHVVSARDRFSLISDVEIDRFYDLVGEVVKTYPDRGTLDLYITDYTSNSLLYEYVTPEEEEELDSYGGNGDSWRHSTTNRPHKWEGPYGKLTLVVRLWQPHAEFADEKVRPGDFVFLRNVRIKLSNMGKLEGQLNQDKQYPNKIDIKRFNDQREERVQDVLTRKEKYFDHIKKLESKASKGPRKQRKKKAKKGIEQARNREESEQTANALNAPEPIDTVMVDSHRPNQHVECAHKDIRLTPLSNILNSLQLRGKLDDGTAVEFPFLNLRYRARVRVVDFYPSKLEDFALPLDDKSYNNQESDQSESEVWHNSSPHKRWEWAFYLLVEDAVRTSPKETPTRMKLLVNNDSAQYLLKLDATDLRQDKQRLKQLEEKLFILWGDLQERKSKGEDISPAHNNAFECCIREYGVPVQNPRAKDNFSARWTRMHGMFETTIRG
ncbi:hypothetical protein M501DRAFT_956178 [Patellaria atrata CBS 101060]|uniref:Protection of telomeres protein 1 n=1 Tax=Patellaria atrata CBS 101060 TaxID=1346257 RepID=A0A9P4S8V6_9PEZI|nr:hypothetical protein M501DRAFT_956178 [Patellaria atrata CBS 101060]